MDKNTIVVIGGGPAGMMASISASRSGSRVLLLEKTPALGKKLLLTGNGRCNFTNTADEKTFLSKFGKNGNFLRDSLKALSPSSLMKFFETRGLGCKVEGTRVFPLDERSSSILRILEEEMARLDITVRKGTSCSDILCEHGQLKAVKIRKEAAINCKTVILSTGGVSYPATGSSGDGLNFSKSLGHNIIPVRPGLVPLLVKENYPELLKGLSLSSVSVKIFSGNRAVRTAYGDLLFTDRGLSGPVILSNSEFISGLLAQKKEVTVSIDIFPGKPSEKIASILSEHIAKEPSKSIKNCFKDLIPHRFLNVLLSLSLSDPEKVSNQVTREERRRLVSLCKDLRATITGTHPIEEAMVTSGGICLKEIDPKTMSSRIIPGLYFAGEIIDIAGDTGGFNLQAAFSTGYLAGISASRR